MVDGRRLAGFLSGAGSPAVILEAGLGGTAEDWIKVQPEVAGFTTVLSYDRAGLGGSDKAPTPRTCQEIVADLRCLISAANLAPPFVLAAHSWSGMNVRWYANCFPQEVAGMVLVDAVHEEKYARFAQILPAEKAQSMWAAIKDPSKNDEAIDRLESIAQVSRTRRPYTFPLVVLTRLADSDEMNIVETSLQAEFLKLSTDSRQLFSQFTDHYIPTTEPELVVSAIRQVVAAIREREA